MSELQQNLDRVRARVAAACDGCGRDATEVRLVAVSKKKEASMIREALQAGQTVFGENRVQEVMAKQPELPGSVEWHLVGHLQSNKVKHAMHCRFALIHSVDSEKILRALDREAAEHGETQAVLLQVNVSGEGSKFGLKPDDVEPLLEAAARLRHVDVRGLMTLPPFTQDPEKAAPVFAALRELRDRAASATGFPLTELSMGMSHDLEVAVREGASMVRIGTDIFGARS